jgi:hypothetical protein
MVLKLEIDLIVTFNDEPYGFSEADRQALVTTYHEYRSETFRDSFPLMPDTNALRWRLEWGTIPGLPDLETDDHLTLPEVEHVVEEKLKLLTYKEGGIDHDLKLQRVSAGGGLLIPVIPFPYIYEPRCKHPFTLFKQPRGGGGTPTKVVIEAPTNPNLKGSFGVMLTYEKTTV